MIPLIPLSLARIITSYNLEIIFAHQSKECNSQHSFTRVTTNLAEYMKLLQIGIFYVCLFTKFSFGSLLDRLAHAEETTWQSPSSFIRLQTSLYEENIYARPIKAKDNTVCSDSRMRIFICVHTKMVYQLQVQRCCVIMTQPNNWRKNNARTALLCSPTFKSIKCEDSFLIHYNILPPQKVRVPTHHEQTPLQL